MIGREAITATDTEYRAARRRMEHLFVLLPFLGSALVAALAIPAALIGAELGSGAGRFLAAGAAMAVMLLPITFLMWRTGMRQQAATNALMDGLEEQLTGALEHAELEAERRSVQVRRQEFETRLANALEMADGEAEVIDVVERAFVSTLPDSPIELLLADNSHAHLSRMAVSSPTGEPPMCGVDSPDHCPAARRAQVQRFTDSEALDACPKLRGREQGACSAVCVPVSIMGRTVGVLHATGEPGVSFDETSIQDLATLANLSGARIGLLRMVADTQLQAATDSLTGLLNRRSLENRVRALRTDHTVFSVVIADLDHFKALNDTYGHETGDRALRLFAQTLKSSVRSLDLLCRHGGEEFAIVLPNCHAADAHAALQMFRTRLATAARSAGLPSFTASFGVVEARESEDLAAAIARADIALFEAKHSGRNRIVVHDTAGNTLADSELGPLGTASLLPIDLEAINVEPGDTGPIDFGPFGRDATGPVD
jgi:diguanylate cyclase (GGDEF)-like protein